MTKANAQKVLTILAMTVPPIGAAIATAALGRAIGDGALKLIGNIAFPAK